MKIRMSFPLFAAIAVAFAFLIQGCYTELATVDEPEDAYSWTNDDEDTSEYAETPYEDEQDDSYWQSHRYLGFRYYHPSWSIGIYSDPWYDDYAYVYGTSWWHWHDPWYSSWYRWGYYPGWWWDPPVVAYWYSPFRYYPHYGYPYYGATGWRDSYSSTTSRNSGVRRTDGGIRRESGDRMTLPTAGGTRGTATAPAAGRNRSTDVNRTPSTRTETRRTEGRVSSGSTTRTPSSPTRPPSGERREVRPPSNTRERSSSTPPSGSSRRSSGESRSNERSSRSEETPRTAPSSPAPSYSPPTHSSPPSSAPSSPPASSGGGSRRESGGSRR